MDLNDKATWEIDRLHTELTQKIAEITTQMADAMKPENRNAELLRKLDLDLSNAMALRGFCRSELHKRERTFF